MSDEFTIIEINQLKENSNKYLTEFKNLYNNIKNHTQTAFLDTLSVDN
jgi:hypothetical protein